MVTRNRISVIPSAARLVRSLRDLGYDFAQAVADLVDNSLTAGADAISIDLQFEGPDSWLRITDNGHGMGGTEITEAMRYGAQQVYDEEALGKFGLGLKTASLSQCRKLTVASRRSVSTRRIEVRELDLDHVTDTDRWEILVPGSRERDPRVIEPLTDTEGTVVLWESLDRLLGYKIPWGKRARSALRALEAQLELHLGMTFHRFLNGGVQGQRPVCMQINGRGVRSWDPFARSEPDTTILPGHDFDVATSDGVGLVRFQPFVLPPKERFSSEDAFDHYAGPRRWNAQQGLYIYRANRMIQSGGWCRMRAADEHMKLARASLDFYPDLDAAFQVNVAKVHVVLPPELRERLKEPIDQLARTAQSTYRRHSSSSARTESKGWKSVELGNALEQAARRARRLGALRQIARELKQTSPEAARRLGW